MRCSDRSGPRNPRIPSLPGISRPQEAFRRRRFGSIRLATANGANLDREQVDREPARLEHAVRLAERTARCPSGARSRTVRRRRSTSRSPNGRVVVMSAMRFSSRSALSCELRGGDVDARRSGCPSQASRRWREWTAFARADIDDQHRSRAARSWPLATRWTYRRRGILLTSCGSGRPMRVAHAAIPVDERREGRHVARSRAYRRLRALPARSGARAQNVILAPAWRRHSSPAAPASSARISASGCSRTAGRSTPSTTSPPARCGTSST